MLLLRRVVGESMVPTLRPGQIVLASNRRKPRVGNIVIFVHLGRENIKRVKQVNKLGILVVGDNPTESTDSRDFGEIDFSLVLGTLVWPRK